MSNISITINISEELRDFLRDLFPPKTLGRPLSAPKVSKKTNREAVKIKVRKVKLTFRNILRISAEDIGVPFLQTTPKPAVAFPFEKGLPVNNADCVIECQDSFIDGFVVSSGPVWCTISIADRSVSLPSTRVFQRAVCTSASVVGPSSAEPTQVHPTTVNHPPVDTLGSEC